ncbi:MAG: matrixin family metalloprotease [Archangium sp.]|nr:matrixin family metalloprotease [Archangium sp.]
MNRLLTFALVSLSLPVLATPGSNRWSLDSCTTSCRVRATNQTTTNMSCLTGKCYPEVRFATAVWNRPSGTGAGTSAMAINGTQAVSYAVVLTGMQSAFQKWSVSNTALTCTTSMNFEFQGTYASPTGTTAINGNDGNNNVIWLGGNFWRHGSGTLGVTTTSFFPGEITDADMELNNNSTWANDGRQTAIDYESVVTHEAGHFVGMDHTNSGNAVMNPSVGNGVVKRALLAPDVSDLCTMYPGAAGGQGATCTSATQCAGGRVCEGASGSTNLICTQDCTAVGATCPTGFSCQASTAGFACLPQVGVSDLCRFCTTGADCVTGQCLTNGSGNNWCSTTCNPSVAGACGAGYNCTTIGTSSYCIPTASCTNQCTVATAATDCAPGYECVGGSCNPTGNVGDRCEVSGVCNMCGQCITDATDPNLAFCRSCCNGLGECAGCTSTTCTSGQSCTGLSGSTERVCVPSSGASLCQACSATVSCQSGLNCVAGLCRSPCNPTNPGTCAACAAVSGGGGVCVCGPSETADEGQACSFTVPIRICRTGLRCSSGTCRTPCTPTAPVPCGTGFTCSNVGGANVCIPGGAGGGSAGGGPAGGGTSGTGGGTSGTGGGTSGTGGGTSGTGGGTSGTGGGTSGTGGGTSGVGGGTSGTGGGTSGTGGGTSGVGGGTSGTGGGTSGVGGGSGAGVGVTCGPSNCMGCCASGICVSFPSSERCGVSGAECKVCANTQTCNAGMCVAKPATSSCLGCSSAELSPLLLLAVGLLRRRRR